MSNFPDDDERLIKFLHQHRPPVPPAAPDLEERIVLAASSSSRQPRRRQLWAVPPALAAGLIISWMGYRVSTPPPAPADPASVEAFLINNWDGVVGETPAASQSYSAETDWQMLAASNNPSL
jgi:hypothetical protein